MRFEKSQKIESCVSDDPRRLSLMHVHLDTRDDGKPVMFASDGHCMAIVPVQLDEDAPHDDAGAIPVEALKRARKIGGIAGPSLEANGAIKLTDGSTLPRPDVECPDWRHIVRQCDDDDAAPVMIRIGLNPSLLKRVAEAMGIAGGDGCVQLVIRGDCLPIRVQKPGTEAFGIVMPARL